MKAEDQKAAYQLPWKVTQASAPLLLNLISNGAICAWNVSLGGVLSAQKVSLMVLF